MKFTSRPTHFSRFGGVPQRREAQRASVEGRGPHTLAERDDDHATAFAPPRPGPKPPEIATRLDLDSPHMTIAGSPLGPIVITKAGRDDDHPAWAVGGLAGDDLVTGVTAY